MTEGEWRELARLAWNAAKTSVAKERGWCGRLAGIHYEATTEANRIQKEHDEAAERAFSMLDASAHNTEDSL